MGKKRLRRKAFSKQTKSQRRKRKKQLQGPALQFADESIRNSWNRKLTLRQNYKRLGLATNIDSALKAAQRGESKEGIITNDLKRIQQLPKPEKYQVKSMDIDEQRRLRKLMQKYGEDYRKMARDIDINIFQLTATKLRQRMELYKRLLSASGVC